ncbi:hypothetical protein CEXT_701031 [Caerostris extrusa]|uniref:RNase H type-1 domain-containing protein n=1 Tax=Caerostris extrusa TaxID=172846 RepID=A0AAV4VG89_CAEEX|nr:hypothetical protein CEXT_701031 [Caerostris extrusa]
MNGREPTRLKRSSTLQLDKDIRSRINVEHSSLDFAQEPLFPRKPPSETKFAYTDGFSDKFLNKGGAGIFFLPPNGSKYHHKRNTGLIASKFTSELVAIKEAVALYLNDSNILGLTDGKGSQPEMMSLNVSTDMDGLGRGSLD